MEVLKADRALIRAGFVLFTLSLLTGFAVPAFLNHRMAVTGGVLASESAKLLSAFFETRR